MEQEIRPGDIVDVQVVDGWWRERYGYVERIEDDGIVWTMRFCAHDGCCWTYKYSSENIKKSKPLTK